MKRFANVVLGVLAVTAVAYGVAVLVVRAQEAARPSLEVTEQSGPQLDPVAGFSVDPPNPGQNGVVVFNAQPVDVSGVASVTGQVIRESDGTAVADLAFFDDGFHNDGTRGDGIFGAQWNTGTNSEEAYSVDLTMVDRLGYQTITPGATFAIGKGECEIDDNCLGNDICCSNICSATECTTDAECDDDVPATSDSCQAGCPQVCVHEEITECVSGDGWCPVGCTLATDAECEDTTAPVVSMVNPVNGTTITDAELVAGGYVAMANATDPESGINRVVFFLDGVEMTSALFDNPAGSGNFSVLLNMLGVPNGAHTVTATAFNGVNLSASVTSNITLNRTLVGPTVTIESPLSGSYNSTDTINVTVLAQDDVMLSSMSLFSSGGGGALSTVALSTNFARTTMAITAGSIVRAEEVTSYAIRNPRFILPFVKVADATIVNNQNCTTTTTTSNKGIYAVATDSDGQSSFSPSVTYAITRTTTTCVPIAPPPSGGAG